MSLQTSTAVSEFARENPRITAFAISAVVATPVLLFVLQVLQWQLEHTQIYRRGDQLIVKRITTAQTSDMKVTPIAPPILSNMVRLADTGVDSAQSASGAVQSFFGLISGGLNKIGGLFS